MRPNAVMYLLSAGFAVAGNFFSEMAVAQGYSDCGNPFQNAYGPYDYRTATDQQKHLVEITGAHFTTSVETLRSGNTGTLGGELDYTLRVFPNHTRALMAMVRLGQRDKTIKPQGAQ